MQLPYKNLLKPSLNWLLIFIPFALAMEFYVAYHIPGISR
jgi:hypothetical protein